MDASNLEHIMQFVLGCIVLLAGRNIFWLFIALAGFLVGFELAGIWLAEQTLILKFTLALGAGLLGAVLAVVFERLAFALAGFYAMAYLAIILIDRTGLAGGETLIIVVSGLVGAILAALAMDWAIILLSALVGSAAIVAAFSMAPMIEFAVFIILAVIGIVVQRALLARRSSS